MDHTDHIIVTGFKFAQEAGKALGELGWIFLQDSGQFNGKRLFNNYYKTCLCSCVCCDPSLLHGSVMEFTGS